MAPLAGGLTSAPFLLTIRLHTIGLNEPMVKASGSYLSCAYEPASYAQLRPGNIVSFVCENQAVG